MKYLIALIALALPTYLIRFDIGGIPTTLLEVLIYAIFLIGLWKLAYCQWLKVRQTFWLPIGLLLIALIISTIIAPDKLAAAGQVRAYFIDPLLVFWLMVCYLEAKDFSWVFLGLAGSGLFVSVHTIVLKILGEVTSDGRVIGIFGYSPNYVALFLAPIAVMVFAYGINFTKKNIKLAVISYLLSAISIVAIYFSGSRGGLLAVVGGIIFYLILKYWGIIRKKMLYKLGVLLLITLAIFGTAWFFKPNFQASGGRVTSSNNLRWQIWGVSFELGAKHPLFGVGLANFQPAFSDFTKNRGNFPEYITPQALSPHNIFLMFWLTGGILGLVAFIWLLVIFYQTGFKNLSKPWTLILLAAMTTIILQGLVDTPYFKNDLSIMFWLILGLMLLLNYESKLKE